MARVRRRIAPLSCLLLIATLCRAATDPPPDALAVQRLIESGRYAAADSAGEAYVLRLRRTARVQPSELARATELWAQARTSNGKATDSLTIALQLEALRLTESDPTAAPQALVKTLSNTGRMLLTAGKPAESLPYLERGLGLGLKVFGPDSDPCNVIRTVWANSLKALERYPEAETLFRAAIASLGRQQPGNVRLLASAQNGLGAILGEEGRLLESLGFFQSALANYEVGLGPFHPLTNQCRANIAAVSQLLGDLAIARETSERALNAQIQALGPNAELVALSLSNHGALLLQMGEYSAARDTLRRAIAVYEATRGKDDLELADPLVSLGRVLRFLGEDAAAKAAFDRSLVIREASGQRDQPALVGNLLARAELESDENRPADAQRDAERARDICVAKRGYGHPETAAAYQSLVDVDLREARYGAAVARCDSVLSALRRGLGPRHVAVLQLMLQRCAAEAARGHHVGLPDTLAWIVAQLTNQPGLSPLIVSDAEAQLAGALWTAGANARAIDAAVSSDRRLRTFLSIVIQGLPERIGLRLAAHGRPGLEHLLDWAASGETAARAAWTSEAADRGLLLEYLAWRRHELRAVADPRLRAFRDSLASARARLAYLALLGPGDDPDSYAGRLDHAATERDRLELSLSTFLRAPFRSASLDSAANDFLARLRDGQSIVGYCRHSSPQVLGHAGSPPRYLAFVGVGRHVRAVDLGPASRLDSVAVRWRELASHAPASNSASRDADLQATGRKLRQLVWDPVAALSGKASRVFLVPDGALSLVNMGALPTDGSGYLVEGEAILQVLDTERELARRKDAQPSKGLLALGGIQFGRTSDDGRSAPVSLRGDDDVKPDSGGDQRSPTPPCARAASLSFRELQATGSEVDSVGNAWPASAGAKHVLRGAEASEAAFKRMAPGHRVIHLATHAFFLSGDCDSSSRGTGGMQGVRGDRPLLNCGLALANANERGHSGSPSEDGLLTGEEVAGLDLSGTAWAVLSACETGLGVDQASEGLFGLRTAFSVAGARDVIASLWKVEDAATAAWAGVLYRSPGSNTGDASAAIRDASRAILTRRRALGWSTHPYYWGAFVATGM